MDTAASKAWTDPLGATKKRVVEAAAQPDVLLLSLRTLGYVPSASSASYATKPHNPALAIKGGTCLRPAQFLGFFLTVVELPCPMMIVHRRIPWSWWSYNNRVHFAKIEARSDGVHRTFFSRLRSSQDRSFFRSYGLALQKIKNRFEYNGGLL